MAGLKLVEFNHYQYSTHHIFSGTHRKIYLFPISSPEIPLIELMLALIGTQFSL